MLSNIHLSIQGVAEFMPLSETILKMLGLNASRTKRIYDIDRHSGHIHWREQDFHLEV